MASESSRACTTCDIDLTAIAGSNVVTEMLGYWPCFHDSVLESLHLDGSAGARGADIRAELVVHKMLGDVDERGFYKSTDHARLTFLFRSSFAKSMSMELFPDVVIDIAIRRCDAVGARHVAVEVGLAAGGVAFQCENIEIIDAKRLDLSDQSTEISR